MEVLGVYVPTWLLLLLFTAILIYIWLTWHHGELTALGIPHQPPRLLTGNMGMLMNKPGILHMDIELRKKYGDVWGFYEGRSPIIVVADVDIIKQVMVKDFNNFVNRRMAVLPGIFRFGLFSTEDNHWKHLRRLSSPAFSSGKLKYMARQINICASQLKESLQEKADKGISFEGKEVCSAFTMDVIAATAFGLQLDSQKNPNSQFMVNAKAIIDRVINPVLLFIRLYFKDLLVYFNRFGVAITSGGALDFFINILKQTLRERRESNKPSDQVDFLTLMMQGERLLDNADEEVKKEIKEGSLGALENRKEKGMTDIEIMAQSILFLLAGYETTATTMKFTMYLLATNQEIQDKVLAEVLEVWGDKEELQYEDLNRLKYMEMCIEETLRLYPPAVRVDRRAAREVTYKGITIPKDYIVAIPIRLLHYDPDIWLEPEKFDPERFSPEAKAARNPYYYMPFGAGPRNCVGMRLAQMELKMALATVIKHFHLKVSSKCKEPPELENSFLLKVKGGIWLDVKAR